MQSLCINIYFDKNNHLLHFYKLIVHFFVWSFQFLNFTSFLKYTMITIEQLKELVQREESLRRHL